jgi:hypothetical protein
VADVTNGVADGRAGVRGVVLVVAVVVVVVVPGADGVGAGRERSEGVGSEGVEEAGWAMAGSGEEAEGGGKAW